MDPVTIALIAAAIFAARGIKRAAAPPPTSRSPEAAGAPEAPSFGFPSPVFGGGLRPPVTHRAITPERVVEGSAEARGGGPDFGAEPASPGGLPPGLGRATSAMASGTPADFAGAPTAPGGTISQSQRGPSMFQWVTPTQGRYVGQAFLVPAGSPISPFVRPIGGPVAG